MVSLATPGEKRKGYVDVLVLVAGQERVGAVLWRVQDGLVKRDPLEADSR